MLRLRLTLWMPLAWLCLAVAIGGGKSPSAMAQQDDTAGAGIAEETAQTEAEREQAPLDLSALQNVRNPIRPLLRRYRADREILERYYNIEMSPTRHERMRRYHEGWLAATANLESDDWDSATRREFRRLREQIYRSLADVEATASRWMDVSPLLPFGETIIALAESRQAVEPLDPVVAAEHAQRIAALAKATNETLAGTIANNPSEIVWPKSVIEAAAADCDALRKVLRAWFEFYNAYDPGFTWWVKQPFADAEKQLEAYGKQLTDLASARPSSSPRPGGEGEYPLAGESLSGLRHADWPAAPLLTSRVTSRETMEAEPEVAVWMSLLPNRVEPVIGRYAAEFARGRRDGGRGRGVNRESIERWQAALQTLEFESFDVGEQVDCLLLQNALDNQRRRLELPREAGEDVSGPAGIRGRPIGREALLVELHREMIPYTPEELIEIAVRELAWCRNELVQASRALGFGDDWRAAVEYVKTMYVPPGEQPMIVRQLSDEAVSYLREHQLLTIPPLANETWRMRMMPLDQQLITPFFTGGEVVSVGYPTHDMPHDAKLQSLRGNNIPFSRATVHHELIPGHGLQAFMTARYASYRSPFSTPFWTEGWALYWEMLLYDHGFVKTPADRVGFMVWRSHRCARIVFSLSFHLGLMTPGECVDYLVENVGFERMGAEGEVRRSFGGMYPPLYQAAYMLGGLQFRALHREFVGSGQMTDREFHDFILRQGRIPVAMIRLLLQNRPLNRSDSHEWRFYTSE